MTLQEIKNYIIARIYPNTQQEITGQALQDTLTTMAEELTTREDFEAYKSEVEEQIADRVTASEFEAYQDDMAEALGGKQATLVSGENIKTVSGKSLVGSGNIEITKEDVGLGNVDNTSDANKPISMAVAAALLGKQDTLTLSVNDNGNIVIGNLAGQTKEFMAATPSGDPQHYLYEAVGAVYNASTGYWSMYDMTDVTNEEMRAACARGVWNPSETTPFRQDTQYFTYRFSLFRTGPYNAAPTGGLAYWAYYNKDIEVINIGSNPKMGGSQNITCGNSMLSAFSNCSKLRAIINGQLSMAASPTTIVMTNAFAGCSALEDIKIIGLKASISFVDSPNLSYDSVLYMLENSDTSVSGTIITLNPDAYDRIMAEDASGDSDIGNYLNNYSHIELARG